jgi:hypothetical protein
MSPKTSRPVSIPDKVGSARHGFPRRLLGVRSKRLNDVICWFDHDAMATTPEAADRLEPKERKNLTIKLKPSEGWCVLRY